MRRWQKRISQRPVVIHLHRVLMLHGMFKLHTSHGVRLLIIRAGGVRVLVVRVLRVLLGLRYDGLI